MSTPSTVPSIATSSEARDVFCLSVHASYRCRHSGACCSSGWAIPVEASLAARDTAVMAPLVVPRPGLPAGYAGVLRTRADGTCACFDRSSRLCDLQRRHDHGWLPISCQQFPRVSLLDARGTFVTLSHYCPTAASLLFEDVPIHLVRNAPAFPPGAHYDGLDARDGLPPLLRPGVLMDWETLAAWDRIAFELLDRETRDVDAAVQRLIGLANALRQWRADDGPMVAWLGAIRAREAGTQPASAASYESEPDRHDDTWTRWIAPAWREHTRPLCRYAAAKLCGSWCWYQGSGLRTVLRSVEAALALVRAEAARQVRRHGRMLDRALLTESIRQADLRLLHLASPDALARQWSACEADAPRARERDSHAEGTRIHED